jgi:hypothetical protein
MDGGWFQGKLIERWWAFASNAPLAFRACGGRSCLVWVVGDALAARGDWRRHWLAKFDGRGRWRVELLAGA